jgi:hypothetical protein
MSELDKNAQLRESIDKATILIGDLTRQLSKAHERIGRLEGERQAAEWPGVIDGWKEKVKLGEDLANMILKSDNYIIIVKTAQRILKNA